MLKQTAEESIHYLKSPKIKAPSSNNSHLDLWIWVSQNLASPNPMAHFSESEAVPVAVHGCKILLQPFVLLWDHVVVVKIHLAPFKDPMDSMEGSQKLLVMVRLFTIPFILLSFCVSHVVMRTSRWNRFLRAIEHIHFSHFMRY